MLSPLLLKQPMLPLLLILYLLLTLQPKLIFPFLLPTLLLSLFIKPRLLLILKKFLHQLKHHLFKLPLSLEKTIILNILLRILLSSCRRPTILVKLNHRVILILKKIPVFFLLLRNPPINSSPPTISCPSSFNPRLPQVHDQ